jgi:TonB-linked SusC/RagA family outer membrane protein
MRKIVCILTVSLLFALSSWAQTSRISGTVKDQAGEPVPFATVTVKGTKVSVAGSVSGTFTLPGKAGDVLAISAVGFKSLEVQVGSDGNVVAVMERVSGSTTPDVVVTTSFGIQRQAKSLGYATTKITNKDLVQAKPVNVQNGLTGKVAGLQINTVNNGVGAPTRIVLRGNRSLTGNNQALIIVDGAIFYNDLSTLNPEDIASTEILKGASASTLYGSDGSNGVIVITTKKGSRGTSTINFTSTTQFETVSYMPALQNRFGANGGEKFVNDFNDYSTNIPYENQSYGPEYNPNVSVPIGRPTADGSLQIVPFAALANEKRDFFDVGLTTQNQLSFSGGDDNGSFLLSYQNVNVKGIMPKDELQRNTLRFTGRRKINKFTADYSVSYANQRSNTTSTFNVYSTVYSVPAHIPLTQYSDLNSQFGNVNDYFNDYYDNPYWFIENDRNINNNTSLQGTAAINFQATKWLNFSYRIGATYSGNDFTNNIAEKRYTDFAKSNDVIIYATPDGLGLDTVTEGAKFIATDQAASYFNAKSNNFLWTSDFTATFDKDIANKWNLKLIAGSAFMDNRIVQSSVGAPTLNFNVFNVDSRVGLPTVGESSAQARRLGLFGDATISYDNKIFLNGSYRSDLDSRLSKENRWIPYYGATASFVLTDIIPTIKSDKVLNFAKLRAAYSVTGNASALGGGSQFIANGAYQTSLVYFSGGGFPFGDLPGYVPSSTIPNPDIRPEQIEEIELGFELGFMDNRLNINGAVFQTKLTDGIVFASVSPGTSGTRALVNAAATQNDGFELSADYTVINRGDFTWKVNANWSHIESEVVSINQGVPELQIGGSNGNAFAIVGEPYPSIKSRDWVRDSASGKVIVDPVSGLPTPTATLATLGNAVPVDILGIGTNIKWKAFSLAVVADYRGGHDIFNSLGQFMDFAGVTSTTAATGRQRFVFPNSVVLQDGKYVDNTNITTNDANFNFWPGVYQRVGANYVISGAAWKLREVALTYTFPTEWFSRTRIVKSASFTVSGRNLIMIRPKTNLWTDPEFSDGNDNAVGRTTLSQAPPTRIFGATLSVNF